MVELPVGTLKEADPPPNNPLNPRTWTDGMKELPVLTSKDAVGTPPPPTGTLTLTSGMVGLPVCTGKETICPTAGTPTTNSRAAATGPDRRMDRLMATSPKRKVFV